MCAHFFLWRALRARVTTSIEAAAVEAVSKDLMEMKVAELKEELEARDELKTGNKAWLRRRLHGAIVRVHLEATAAE